MSWGGRKVAKLRAIVVALHGTTCWLCGQPIRGKVTVDHVVPRSRGGTDELPNLRPAHPHCNYSRGAKMGNEVRRLPRPSREW